MLKAYQHPFTRSTLLSEIEQTTSAAVSFWVSINKYAIEHNCSLFRKVICAGQWYAVDKIQCTPYQISLGNSMEYNNASALAFSGVTCLDLSLTSLP